MTEAREKTTVRDQVHLPPVPDGVSISDLDTLLAGAGLDQGTLIATPQPTTLVAARSRPQTQDEKALRALPTFAISEASSIGAELQLLDTIGQGGMGVIRKALQVPLGRDVAVKSVRPDRVTPEATLALLREAWVTGGLEHPNVIPVHALGRGGDDEPLLVMKKVEGVAWCDIIRGAGDDPRQSATGDILGRDLEILLAVCNAVEFAHSRGIVHRDLKPENVMVGAFGEVYVLDWGLAVSVEDNPGFRVPRARDINGVGGTPCYLAPEMVTAQADKIGKASDVFLIGAILHEILTGRGRNEGDTLAEVLLAARDVEPFGYDADVPPELAEIANKATSREPDDRYPDARAFHRALATFMHRRHSLDLAATAHRRLTSLREAIAEVPLADGASKPPPDEDFDFASADSKVRSLLTECRFGFQLSLRDWPGNESARLGLQEALREAAWYELRRERPHTAATLIAEIQFPEEALIEALRELREAEEARKAQLKALRRMEVELDVDVGKRTRAFISLLLAGFYGLLSVLAGVATSQGWFQWDHGHNTFVAVDFVGAVALFAWWARHTMFRTEVNRRIMSSMLAVGGAQILMAATGWWLQLAPVHVMIVSLVLWCTYFLVFAATTDRRLFGSALVYLMATVGAATNLDYAWWFLAIGHFGGPAMAAIVWRPEKDYVRAEDRVKAVE